MQKYIRSGKKRISGKLFWFGQIFFFFAIASIIALTLRRITIDINDSSEFMKWQRTIVVICYGNQIAFLLLVLIIRLNIMFKDTIYKLSKVTVSTLSIVWIIMYAVIPVLIVIFKESSIFFTIVALIILICGIFNSVLCVIFIKKLLEINKNSDKKTRDKLLNVITKTSILTVISCIFTWLSSASFCYQVVNKQYQHSVFPIYFELFDSFTNFFCIMLSFRYFDDKYYLFCGCLDRKCKSLCEAMTVSEILGPKSNIVVDMTATSNLDKSIAICKRDTLSMTNQTEMNESKVSNLTEISNGNNAEIQHIAPSSLVQTDSNPPLDKIDLCIN